MTHALVAAIVAADQQQRVGVLEAFAERAGFDELVRAARDLHRFAQDERRNVYQRVRATLQAHAIYRYFVPDTPGLRRGGHIPRRAHELLLEGHFGAAVDALQQAAQDDRLSNALASALAVAHHSSWTGRTLTMTRRCAAECGSWRGACQRTSR